MDLNRVSFPARLSGALRGGSDLRSCEVHSNMGWLEIPDPSVETWSDRFWKDHFELGSPLKVLRLRQNIHHVSLLLPVPFFFWLLCIHFHRVHTSFRCLKSPALPLLALEPHIGFHKSLLVLVQVSWRITTVVIVGWWSDNNTALVCFFLMARTYNC